MVKQLFHISLYHIMLYIRLNLYLLVRWARAIVHCQYVGQGIKFLSGKYLLTQWIGHILMLFFITKQSKSFFLLSLSFFSSDEHV